MNDYLLTAIGIVLGSLLYQQIADTPWLVVAERIYFQLAALGLFAVVRWLRSFVKRKGRWS